MSSSLVSEELQPGPTPSKPRQVTGLAGLGLVIAVLATLAMAKAASMVRDYNHQGTVATIVGVVLVVVSLYPWIFAFRAFVKARERSALLAQDDLVASRRVAASGREEAFICMGWAAAVLIVAFLIFFVFANSADGGGVVNVFFKVSVIKASFQPILKAFWTNIWVACVSEVLVLIFGLLVAVVRMLPGRAGAPLRAIAVLYCDIFRAIPAIVVLTLVVFGLPLTGVKFFQTIPTVWLGIFALSLTYTSYVSEVYRAGLSSIHPSQSAAARSLGLSYGQTLRTVLVPQAVRRVIPPLLNDFISLQKDTALLSVVGISEALLVANLYEAKYFNLSPIAVAAFLFILITIPQARFVDYLIERDTKRRAGGS